MSLERWSRVLLEASGAIETMVFGAVACWFEFDRWGRKQIGPGESAGADGSVLDVGGRSIWDEAVAESAGSIEEHGSCEVVPEESFVGIDGDAHHVVVVDGALIDGEEFGGHVVADFLVGGSVGAAGAAGEGGGGDGEEDGGAKGFVVHIWPFDESSGMGGRVIPRERGGCQRGWG